MTSLRRPAAAALATLALTVALVAGCQPKKPAEETGPVAPSPARVAAARAAYGAKADMLVGQVDDANQLFAAVSGIDPAAVKKGDTISFIDVTQNRIINNGTVNDTSASGRLIVEFDKQGERAPRAGDLAIKLK
jgi:hypothetical protein